MQLILNNRHITLQSAPDQTLLAWLRQQQRLTGTKEGCCVGDCGACTVLVGRLNGAGQLQYASTNACICLLGSLHGCHLVTVEVLAQGDRLHPVQQALVDHHASQCGFCTPGFVMALLAWWLNSEPCPLDTPEQLKRHRQQVEQALSGNLCRCTGYRPILAAAEALATLPRSGDGLVTGRAQVQKQLGAIAAAPGSAFMRPASAEQLAQSLHQQPNAQLVAGATDLALEVTQKGQGLPQLIDLQQVTELQQLEASAAGLWVGAGVTLSRLAQPLTALWPAVGPLLERFASQQVRNRATLGGNLANASPIADLPPLLLALGAELELQSIGGVRRLAIADFYQGYRETALAAGEFIRRVWLPAPKPGQRLWLEKVSKRQEDDISATCVALSLTLEGERPAQLAIACGGMAAVPARAPHTEAALQGQPLTPAALTELPKWLAQDYQPLSDMRASAAYRLAVTARLLQGFLREALV